MLIGIISDTHNDIEMTLKALNEFQIRGVSMLIHAGDITSPRLISFFKDFDSKIVLGNGDLDSDLINSECIRFGFGPVQKVLTITVDSKIIHVSHGNNISEFRNAIDSAKYDYIIKGHTHMFENYISQGAHIINPGALYAADEYTVAVLDLVTDTVEKIYIDRDES
jgi:putative phosphoesterase